MGEVGLERDRLATILAWGLGLILALAPLPFGAVRPTGRLIFELAVFAVGAIWLARAWFRRVPLPSAPAAAGLVGLLALGALQILPLGASVVGMVSPAAARLAEATRAPEKASAAEAALLGEDPTRYDRAPTLSVDRPATAGALRTGAALGVILLVAASVASASGPKALAIPLLIGSVFQAFYGLAVLATGDATIWGEAKAYYLDAATGTFVNKNHFAIYVAAGSAAGFGLAIGGFARALRSRRRSATFLIDRESVQAALALLATLIALSGLLLSLSRAGIFLGALAMAVVLLAGARSVLPGVVRAIAFAVLLLVAAVPLIRFGTERLTTRFEQSLGDLEAPGARYDVWQDTLRIVRAYPVAGAGFGAFAAIYPSYRSPEVRLRYRQAHNDFLQLAAEGGVPALIFFALLVVPLGITVWPALIGRHGPIWTGLAAALAAIAIHAVVDFPFHIPAVAAVGAALAGAMLGAPWRDRS